jgi:phage shock protein A
MGLFDRISRVVRSNVNAAVSAAEDPEKILEQTVLDMQDNLVQLRKAAAESIATQKRLEQQYNQAESQSAEWQNRAMLALQKGNEDLAKEALSRKQTYTQTATALKQQLDQASVTVANQKKALMAIESKLAEAKTKKDMLKARAKAAKATEQLNQALSTVDTASAIGAFERMEDKVLQMEARTSAMAELTGDKLESQFAALESGSDVETELQLLKAQLEPGAPQQSLPQGASGALPEGQTTAAPQQQSAAVDAELEALKAELDKPPM